MQKSPLVWDIFRGQKTDKVMSKLSSMSVEAVSVPANMTHFFQPLDLTVNNEAKRFMKERFTKWYAEEVQTQMESGVRTEDIMVDLRVTVIKPLHDTWLIELFNHLSSREGSSYIAKGWEKAGISAVVSGETKLSPEDPSAT